MPEVVEEGKPLEGEIEGAELLEKSMVWGGVILGLGVVW